MPGSTRPWVQRLRAFAGQAETACKEQVGRRGGIRTIRPRGSAGIEKKPGSSPAGSGRPVHGHERSADGSRPRLSAQRFFGPEIDPEGDPGTRGTTHSGLAAPLEGKRRLQDHARRGGCRSEADRHPISVRARRNEGCGGGQSCRQLVVKPIGESASGPTVGIISATCRLQGWLSFTDLSRQEALLAASRVTKAVGLRGDRRISSRKGGEH